MTRFFKYTVRAGDTLSAIASHIKDVNLKDIELANPHIDTNLIRVGQVINIPAKDNNAPPSPPPSSPKERPTVAAENIGYWDWTWHDKPATSDTTIGLAFSGKTGVDIALAKSAHVYNRLVGAKYICLGGGGKEGRFDKPIVNAITTAIEANKFKDYEGIAYDVEVGKSGLTEAFKTSFAAAKAKGFKVLVTISHSAPFGVGDAVPLMRSFFADANIDFLSPQLYTTGKEKANEYAITATRGEQIHWKEYANAKALVIPSIVHASYYADAQHYFKKQGVELKGYIRWGY